MAQHFRTLPFAFALLCGLALPQSGFPDVLPKPGHTQQQPKTVTGAASLDELSAAIFAAVKNNDFNQISKFFPTQTELTAMQKGTNKNLQALTEKLTPEQIEAAFKTDFETLMQLTTERMLNWTEHNLSETSPSRLRSPQINMAPVKMYLASGEHAAPYYLVYEAVRIKNRYYLFQHITLQKSG